MVVSRLSPALTATILPAWLANNSPIARALLRRTATPVRISAPVSISSGSTSAYLYCFSMKAPSASASMVSPSTIGRQQDVGLVEGLADGDDVAAVVTLQQDAREHQMRGRGADIDPDAEHDDLVLALERAPGRGKEDAAAFVVCVITDDQLPHACRARARTAGPGVDHQPQKDWIPALSPGCMRSASAARPEVTPRKTAQAATIIPSATRPCSPCCNSPASSGCRRRSCRACARIPRG